MKASGSERCAGVAAKDPTPVRAKKWFQFRARTCKRAWFGDTIRVGSSSQRPKFLVANLNGAEAAKLAPKVRILLGLVCFVLVSMPVTAAPDAPPKQFDLSCTGTKTLFVDNSTSPWSMTYRVDLSTSQFCVADCVTPIAIKRIEPNEIALQDDRTSYYWFRTLLDRTTGQLRQRVGYFLPAMVNLSFEVSATCVRKQFSGLPVPKF